MMYKLAIIDDEKKIAEGICCQDLLGNGCAADFEWFAYQCAET